MEVERREKGAAKGGLQSGVKGGVHQGESQKGGLHNLAGGGGQQCCWEVDGEIRRGIKARGR